MTVATKLNLNSHLLTIASRMIDRHIEHEDCESCRGEGRIEEDDDENNRWRECLDCRGTGQGEQCFNLFRFIESLSTELDGQFNSRGKLGDALGRFQLDGIQTARLLWCQICLQAGERPDGTTFRGMPILD